MIKCMYCREEFLPEDMTLEHTIPQFLGGAYASSIFHSNDACSRCNSNLGLFVDASFASNSLINGWLQLNGIDLYDPKSEEGIVPICMGCLDDDVLPPGLQKTEVCELYIGALGETVHWIRPDYQKFFGYVGGDPIKARRIPTRAYFAASINTNKNPRITWNMFRDSFDKKKVTKISCTVFEGHDLKKIGFSDPDPLDCSRIDFFRHHINQENHVNMAINIQFDRRFMCKLAYGICYALFGEEVCNLEWGKQVIQAIRSSSPIDVSIHGSSIFTDFPQKSTLLEIIGHELAVSIALLPIDSGVVVALTIGKNFHAAIRCDVGNDLLMKSKLPIDKNGVAILCFKPIHKCITMSIPELILHKDGKQSNDELRKVEKSAKGREYFAALKSGCPLHC